MEKKIAFIVVTGENELQVLVPDFNLTANGKTLSTSSIFFNGTDYVPNSLLYKGTTYVPLHFIANEFSKEITWNEETKTLDIKDKEVIVITIPEETEEVLTEQEEVPVENTTPEELPSETTTEEPIDETTEELTTAPVEEVVIETPVEEESTETEEIPDAEEQSSDVPEEAAELVVISDPVFPKQIVTTAYPYLNKATSGGQGNYGSIPKGIVLDVLDATKYFYQVTYKNNTGWISKKFAEEYIPAKPDWEIVADAIIEEAKSFIGVVQYAIKYSPSTMEFDCSSMTKYLFQKHGVIDNLYWGARKQSTYGTHVDKADLRKGDLVFFSTPSNREKYPNDPYNLIGHVGIYIGDNKFIHNLNPRYDVLIGDMSPGKYWDNSFVTARRLIK